MRTASSTAAKSSVVSDPMQERRRDLSLIPQGPRRLALDGDERLSGVRRLDVTGDGQDHDAGPIGIEGIVGDDDRRSGLSMIPGALEYSISLYQGRRP
jgi:hypothetical protein